MIPFVRTVPRRLTSENNRRGSTNVSNSDFGAGKMRSYGFKDFVDSNEEVKEEDVDFLPIGEMLTCVIYDTKDRVEIFGCVGSLLNIESKHLIILLKNGMTFSCKRYTIDEVGNVIHTSRFFKKIK